jgi:hypothetical protein
MDEPLLAQQVDETQRNERHGQQEHREQQEHSAPPPPLASYLPIAWTSIPADLNAPGKLLGSIGLEWM